MTCLRRRSSGTWCPCRREAAHRQGRGHRGGHLGFGPSSLRGRCVLVREVGSAKVCAGRSGKERRLKHKTKRMRQDMSTYTQRAERDPNRAVKNPSWEAAGRRAWMRLWMVTGGKVDVVILVGGAVVPRQERRVENWRTAQRKDFAADQGRRGYW